MHHLVIDGVFSTAGKSTESKLVSLRRSLGKGVDPAFDYSVFEIGKFKKRGAMQFDADETQYHVKSIWYELQRALRGDDVDLVPKNEGGQDAHPDSPEGGTSAEFLLHDRLSPAFKSPERNYYAEKMFPKLLQGAPVGAYRPKYSLVQKRVKTPSLGKLSTSNHSKSMPMLPTLGHM